MHRAILELNKLMRGWNLERNLSSSRHTQKGFRFKVCAIVIFNYFEFRTRESDQQKQCHVD